MWFHSRRSRLALLRVASGKPMFGGYARNKKRLDARRRIVALLVNEGYVVTGRGGPTITHEGRAALAHRLGRDNEYHHEEVATIRRLWPHVSSVAIAEVIGRSDGAVRWKAYRLGLPRRCEAPTVSP